MSGFLAVGLGGGLGAMCRYLVGGLVLHYLTNLKFPLGTLLVNVSGCFLIGLVAGVAERYHLFGVTTRLFLVTGFLGGFTTFSAFGYETLFLIRRGEVTLAGTNVLLNVFASLVAVWLGSRLSGVGE